MSRPEVEGGREIDRRFLLPALYLSRLIHAIDFTDP